MSESYNMSVQFLEMEAFIKKHLSLPSLNKEDIGCSVHLVNESLKQIDAVKLNFHLIILNNSGTVDLTVGYHDFSLQPSSISIVPPHTVFSIKQFPEDFDAYFLLFTSDFLKKGFVKSEIMEELLLINPDYPPVFDLEENDFNNFLYKFKKLKEEIGNHAPFCSEISRLYILQILYDYNRVCEICLLNSDKLMNRQHQVLFEFRKLIDANFHQSKTVKEYADMMYLSPKYIS